jgi:acetyltransferase EpsM
MTGYDAASKRERVMQDLIIIGGGEHARVVIEAARSAAAWNILGFVDPLPCDETVARMKTAQLGADEALGRYPSSALVLGIGTAGLDDRRQKAVARLGVAPERWATVIHAAAWVSPTTTVAAGSVVLAGAIVNSGARIGRHCIINSRACIEHDVTLGDFVHAAPGSIVAGGAEVGDGSYLGIGSLIRDHRTIGRGCLVGMGAAVTANFGDGAVLVGVPARPRR